MTRRARAQRGAALLLAMLILALVATLAAGMAWQQTRAVRIEAAERAAAQAGWILDGALDWARLILREDARTGGADHLGEPWATPLAEARLSSFLAVDQQNNADSGPEAFISGAIGDAQAKYNLRNLVDAEGKPVEAELKSLQRLCATVGVPTDTAERIAAGLQAAWAAVASDGSDAPLQPVRVDDLVWLGVDAATVARLRPYLTLLPAQTAINANTAPREVLVAAIDGLDPGSAERIVQARQRQPFDGLEALRVLLPDGVKADDESRVGVRSAYFEVSGRLRVDDRVVEESSLVERRGADRGLAVVTLRRQRQQLRLGAP